MDCEQVIQLISARVDREISSDQGPALEAHLAQCANCRATQEAFRLQDSDLRRAFAPRRESAAHLAERAIGRIRGPIRMPRAVGQLGRLVLAAAAGFLVALLAFQPWKTGESPASPEGEGPIVVAHLALSTGLLELLPPGEEDWEVVGRGEEVPLGSRVRSTKGACGEFWTEDGSLVRMNAGSEVLFRGGRSFLLDRGEIWTEVAPDEVPWVVDLGEVTVTATGTQFDVSRKEGGALVTVLEGATLVRTPTDEAEVLAGEEARIEGISIASKGPVHDLFLATRWVHEILVLKGRDDPELARRLDQVLAQIGRTKMERLHESEIRSLGDHCALPLARYIQVHCGAEEHAYQRQRAARILADIAQPWTMGELVGLLADPDPEIRVAAAGALERLSGTSLGFATESWRESSGIEREKALAGWRRWWEENRDRFPERP